MNPLTLVTHAVLVGLTPLIPIPVLDDLVKSFFYQNLVRSLASTYGLSLSAGEVAALAEERGRGCLNGCLFGLIEYLLKRLVRKVIFILEWRRAIDLVTHTYYVGHLLEYAFQHGWYTPGDVSRAVQLRAAIERAREDANTRLVKNLVRSSFNQSRALVLSAVQQVSESIQDIAFRRSRMWLRRAVALRLRPRAPGLARWLYRLWRPTEAETTQAAQVEEAVAQTMERESPHLSAALGEVIARLQAGLAELPNEHFDAMQARLEKSLRPAGV